jgi:hypothetical protein
MFMTLPSELPGFAVWKASRGPQGRSAEHGSRTESPRRLFAVRLKCALQFRQFQEQF